MCDCFDLKLAYGYPQPDQNGYTTEICDKYEITPNPSCQYQCSYALEYWVLDMYFVIMYYRSGIGIWSYDHRYTMEYDDWPLVVVSGGG